MVALLRVQRYTLSVSYTIVIYNHYQSLIARLVEHAFVVLSRHYVRTSPVRGLMIFALKSSSLASEYTQAMRRKLQFGEMIMGNMRCSKNTKKTENPQIFFLKM